MPPVAAVMPKQLPPDPLMSAPLRLNSVPKTNEPNCFIAPSWTPANQPLVLWVCVPCKSGTPPTAMDKSSFMSTSPQPPPIWEPKYTPDQLYAEVGA